MWGVEIVPNSAEVEILLFSIVKRPVWLDSLPLVTNLSIVKYGVIHKAERMRIIDCHSKPLLGGKGFAKYLSTKHFSNDIFNLGPGTHTNLVISTN